MSTVCETFFPLMTTQQIIAVTAVNANEKQQQVSQLILQTKLHLGYSHSA